MNSAVAHDDSLVLARRLVDAIESGDHSGADDLLKALNDGRFEALFKEIGKLTRELHDTVGNLAQDERLAALAHEHMPDARERLNYVITKTEEAADRTLTAVEVMQPVNEQLSTQATELARRVSGASDLEHVRAQILSFLEQTTASSDTVRSGLNDILMAQEYQDLTGQVIKRTIGLVNQVEEKLVSLVSACGAITHGTNMPAAVKPDDGATSHGPAVRSDEAVVGRQADVDELLANLGF